MDTSSFQIPRKSSGYGNSRSIITSTITIAFRRKVLKSLEKVLNAGMIMNTRKGHHGFRYSGHHQLLTNQHIMSYSYLHDDFFYEESLDERCEHFKVVVSIVCSELLKGVTKMDEKLFNELFEMTEEQLKEAKVAAYDKWNWDTGSDADKERYEAIEVMLEARKRTGLRK